MEKKIYINAYRQQNDDIFTVDVETFIIININKISAGDLVNLYINLVEGEPPEATVKADLSRVKYKIVEGIPHEAFYCIWPVILIGNYVIAGLCSVARQIVKHSDNRKVKRLLGFREACLMTCSESSIWTKFCEIDVTSMIKSALSLTHSPFIQEDTLTVPPDLLRFEYHMAQPVRMHNVYKIAREKNNDKQIDSKVPIDQLNLHHTFGEGTYMTLSDVILYPCIQIFFSLYPRDQFKDLLPLTLAWYDIMKEKNYLKIKFSVNAAPKIDFASIITPDIVKQSLYTADPARYKPEKRIFTKQKDVVSSLGMIHAIDITNALYPYGDDVTFDWSAIPTEANPTGGALPEKRAYRKCEQLENLTKAVIKMVGEQSMRIVDFCSGSGHLGILIAHLLPKCSVVLIENKEMSLIRARDRIEKLDLHNVVMLQCNLDYFIGGFDVGVSLHACGVATDLVMRNCVKNRANFVCCPCCYGGIHDCYHLTYPRSSEYQKLNMAHKDYLTLAHAADQTHQPNVWKTTQGFVCMDAIDTDRKLWAESCGYEVHLGKLQPISCTNKNNLLVGLLKNM